jgi:ubiquinol-cytochrome c reductase iron-sulfur subunit
MFTMELTDFLAGRARKGPAPLNLEIPEYDFADENTLIIG